MVFWCDEETITRGKKVEALRGLIAVRGGDHRHRKDGEWRGDTRREFSADGVGNGN